MKSAKNMAKSHGLKIFSVSSLTSRSCRELSRKPFVFKIHRGRGTRDLRFTYLETERAQGITWIVPSSDRRALTQNRPNLHQLEQGDTNSHHKIEVANRIPFRQSRNCQTTLAEQHHQRTLLVEHEVGDRPVEHSDGKADQKAGYF